MWDDDGQQRAAVGKMKSRIWPNLLLSTGHPNPMPLTGPVLYEPVFCPLLFLPSSARDVASVHDLLHPKMTTPSRCLHLETCSMTFVGNVNKTLAVKSQTYSIMAAARNSKHPA